MTRTKRPNFFTMFLSAVVVVLLLCAAYTLGLWHSIPKSDERAHFGEMYGGLAALFSGLAFAGVIVAIAMQREELRLQRKELRLTREELRRSAEAQNISSHAMTQQVQLMIAGGKLSAHNILAEFYRSSRSADPTGVKQNEEIGNIRRLLGEINVMSTQPDRPSSS